MDLVKEIKERINLLTVYYFFYASALYGLFTRTTFDYVLWFLLIPFLFIAPLTFHYVLKPPITQVMINITQKYTEHRMNKLVPLLFVCVVFFLVIIFVLGAMYVKEVNTNHFVVEKYNSQYELFVSVCDMNLSEFNKTELKKNRCNALTSFYDLNLYSYNALVEQGCAVDLVFKS